MSLLTTSPHPSETSVLDDVEGEMNELIDQYIVERMARGELNGKSPVVIRSVLASFAQHTSHLALEELSERDIETWIARAELKSATRHSMVTKLKPFIRWLVARDHIVKDFTTVYKSPKVPKGLPRYLEGDQVRELVRACRTSRDRLIVLFMIHLGLRRIEVSRINIEDIDFTDRLLGVRGKNGQGQVTRSLPLPDEVFAALVLYLGQRPASAGPLVRLVNMERRMLEKQIGDLVAGKMLEIGVKKGAYDGMSGHALRHSFAQHLIDDGKDIYQVQSAMGHSSIATTEIYRRRKANGLREMMSGRVYT